MNTNLYHWLKDFATTILPGHILKQPHQLFDAVKRGKGSSYLHALSDGYAKQNQWMPAPQKCLHFNYVTRYKNTEALFIDVWPGLQLQEQPVYLAVLRWPSSSNCRIFRLYYPADRQLYMSEYQLNEHNTEPADLLPYEHAISLVFSYTLGAHSVKQPEDLPATPGQEMSTNTPYELVQ